MIYEWKINKQQFVDAIVQTFICLKFNWNLLLINENAYGWVGKEAGEVRFPEPLYRWVRLS